MYSIFNTLLLLQIVTKNIVLTSDLNEIVESTFLLREVVANKNRFSFVV